MENHNENCKSPLCSMSQTQMFMFGIVAGVLVLCTLGFFVLLGLVLRGEGISLGFGNGDSNVAANLPSDNQPAANAPAAVKSDIPAVTADDHVTGGKNAKVTLVEYSDFECPFCSRYYPTVKQAIQDYGSKIRVVYRHFPLSFHPQSTPAALASECASEQGKFWEFHDGLFENQSRLGDALYKELAGKFGLNMSKFNDCVSSQKYLNKIQQQQAGGSAAGVSGTPYTAVLSSNGQMVEVSGAQPYSALKSAIDSMLNS